MHGVSDERRQLGFRVAVWMESTSWIHLLSSAGEKGAQEAPVGGQSAPWSPRWQKGSKLQFVGAIFEGSIFEGLCGKFGSRKEYEPKN